MFKEQKETMGKQETWKMIDEQQENINKETEIRKGTKWKY